MAPQSRSNVRHAEAQPTAVRNGVDEDGDGNNDDLFLEPMMGTPLAIYIEKDVEDRDVLVEIITVS